MIIAPLASLEQVPQASGFPGSPGEEVVPGLDEAASQAVVIRYRSIPFMLATPTTEAGKPEHRQKLRAS